MLALYGFYLENILKKIHAYIFTVDCLSCHSQIQTILFPYEKCGKVKTLWEGHKIRKKSSTCFDQIAVFTHYRQKMWDIFFKFLLTFQKSWNLPRRGQQ